MKTISETLTEAGLSPSAAEIYLALVELGELTVPKILAKVQISRAMIYDVLPELMAGGYVEYRKDGKTAYYKPVHPGKLLDLVNQKKRDVALLEDEMKTTINTLSGTYNLTLNKPGVRFFEGSEGVKEVLLHSIEHNAGKKIWSVSDLNGYSKHLKDWNTEIYAPRREAAKIHLQAIVPDTSEALAFLKDYRPNPFTQVLLVDHTNFPASTEMNIYDTTVSFVTFADHASVGIIIDNKEITETLISMFRFMWKMGNEFGKMPTPPWLQAKLPDTSAPKIPSV